MFMKSVLLGLIFYTSTALAQNSFEAAKRAAESLRTTPPAGSTKTVPSTPAPVPSEELKPEGMDTLICPEIGPKFIKGGNATFRSMDDLLSALREERKQYAEFFLTLIQLDKTKPDDEVAASQMVDLKKGVDQKLKRAKENYNSQIKELATSLPKSKRCWSYHDAKIKPEIGRLIEIFTKEPVLNEFKKCIRMLADHNKVYEQRFTLSLNYYNKVTSQGTTILEAKKNAKTIESNNLKEDRVCRSFSEGGIYSNYLNNKYDKKDNNTKPTPAPVKQPLDLTKPLKIPTSIGPSFR
jgi:hypothetical protein